MYVLEKEEKIPSANNQCFDAIGAAAVKESRLGCVSIPTCPTYLVVFVVSLAHGDTEEWTKHLDSETKKALIEKSDPFELCLLAHWVTTSSPSIGRTRNSSSRRIPP